MLYEYVSTPLWLECNQYQASAILRFQDWVALCKRSYLCLTWFGIDCGTGTTPIREGSYPRLANNTDTPTMPKLSDSHNLQVVNPDIAKQWHPTKNGTLTPSDVTPMCNLTVWWKCPAGHEGTTTVACRNGGHRCRICVEQEKLVNNNLQTANPELAKQWHPTLNGDLAPKDVAPNSHQNVYWFCDRGHEWKARVQARNQGAGCPICKHLPSSKDESLQALYPELAKQWHPTKNGDRTPADVTAHSGRKVWWRCGREHDWDARINSRTNNGNGCPFCSGRRHTTGTSLQALAPELAKEWHPMLNGSLTPRDVPLKSKRKVWWRCLKGHSFPAQIKNRSNGTACPHCPKEDKIHHRVGRLRT